MRSGPIATENLSLLHTVGKYRAQKTFIAGQNSQPYNAGYLFTVDRQPLENLEQFAELLIRVEQDSTAFVVRGEPKPRSDYTGPVRKIYRGEDAAFDACPKRLFCVDVDKVEAPEGVDPCSPQAIAHVVSLLPQEFHQADVVAQFSNSAGTPGAGRRIKVHLWFWGTRPYADLELRRWAQASGIADFALFNPVQPHYTSRPFFIGLPDPFEGRSRTIFIRGTRRDVAVVLPALSQYASAPRQLPDSDYRLLTRNSDGKIIDGRE